VFQKEKEKPFFLIPKGCTTREKKKQALVQSAEGEELLEDKRKDDRKTQGTLTTYPKGR